MVVTLFAACMYVHAVFFFSLNCYNNSVFMNQRNRKTIYLDYAATTPLEPRVKKAMAAFENEKYGNPSSLHKKGIEARLAIDESRKTIAGLIGARPQEIIFTAGGTESINLGIFGVACAAKKGSHVITTKIEHHAVLRSVEALEAEGFKVTYLDVDKEGFISVDKLIKSIRPETILVSVMYANNEIGSIEPIAEIGKRLNAINNAREKKKQPAIIFHTDACQAAGVLDLNVDRLGVDLMSINGSKIYGPKQTGFLYVRSGINLKPLVYGGGQERGLRSGTENVAGIFGLAKSLEIAQEESGKEIEKQSSLKDYFITKLFKSIERIELNGPEIRKGSANLKLNRLPNNINISFIGCEGEALMLYLDAQGICVSTGSACSTSSPDPSHVLAALGKGKAASQGNIRFSLGKETKKSDLDYVLKVLPNLVKTLRKVYNANK